MHIYFFGNGETRLTFLEKKRIIGIKKITQEAVINKNLHIEFHITIEDLAGEKRWV